MTQNLDKDSEAEWIFSIWVPQIGSIQERERSREREIKKKEQNTIQVQNRKDGKERMHEHMTCKNKDLMGDTQTNPISAHNRDNQAHKSIMHLECNA